MSSLVKTITPFIDREILCQALQECGCQYQIQGNNILTDRRDYFGLQMFQLQQGRFVYLHDSDAVMFSSSFPWENINQQQYKTVSSFLEQVEKHYNDIYQRRLAEIELEKQRAAEEERRRLEEERIRLENERKAFVEKQKNAIIQKAEKKGYYVKEEKVKNKIKLVLLKRTY